MTTTGDGRVSLALAAAGVVLLVLGVFYGTGLAQLGEPDFGTRPKEPVRVVPPTTLMPKPTTRPAAAIPPREPENLLPEQARLVDREGTILRKPVGAAGAVRTVFRSADEKLELVLLENRYLEALENATDYGKKSARLRISGTVTVYRGVNYLLLTRVEITQP